MDFTKFTAKTKDEAITKACISLGVPSDELEIIVDSEGSSGFFGIGVREAVIRARVKEEEIVPEEIPAAAAAEHVKEKAGAPKIKTLDEIEARAQAAQKAAEEAGIVWDEEKPEREPRRNDRRKNSGRNGKNNRRDTNSNRNRRDDRVKEQVEEIEEHTVSAPKPEREVPQRTSEEIETMVQDATKFLADVFASMEMTVETTVTYDEKTGALTCNFEGDEMGILIGKRGQTLDSLQYLTSLVVNKHQKEYVRVKLDTEEYRKRRRETLESLARNIAGKVKRTRHAVVLEPMNPYERRIIHSTLQSNRYVETYSEGEEPFRRVVVAPKKNSY